MPRPRHVWAECLERVRHLRLRGDLEAYADGELTGARRTRMAAHLDRCWVCSGRLQTLRLVKASIRGHPHRAPASLSRARVDRYARQLADTRPPRR
ncbi:zf-HC2 domain-containing protein [Streptomyces sp. E11-3]|uniref:anti-sigma factor family protein n=1 Tax=Streptomyces sp. E11-3 TaxID=3110112 RepID=UPI00397F1A41